MAADDPATECLPKRKTPKRVIPHDRLVYVERLWLRATAERRIRELVCKKFGVKNRQAANYVRLVREKFSKRDAVPSAAVVARAEEMLLRAYETARKRKRTTGGQCPVTEPHPDTATMDRAAWHLAQLHGAVVERHEHTGAKGGPIDVRNSADALLARLLSRAGAGGSAPVGTPVSGGSPGDPASGDSG